MQDQRQHQQQQQQQQLPSFFTTPSAPPPKPTRTGYERYKEPNAIPQLEANADIWGMPSKPTQPSFQSEPARSQPSMSQVTRKMMSLDEVEAAMRAARQPAKSPAPVQSAPQPPPSQEMPTLPSQVPQPQQQAVPQMPQILQRQHQPIMPQMQQQPPMPFPNMQAQGPRILQRQGMPMNQLPPNGFPPQMMQQQGHGGFLGPHGIPQMGGPHGQLPPGPHRQPAIHPDQLMHLSEEDRNAIMAEEAKRAKRNHKIQLLSRDNGLMTPQDKNFITRIQLQQLVTATGVVEESGPEAALAEDFYYQVFSQIRGGLRQNSNQLNIFAQTYLNPTGGRGNRRYGRNGDSHMRRMEQQVQRAVEAAKAKPKNSQLVIEGSLGKISFSNAKTPKPLLNIRRAESGVPRARPLELVTTRKAILKDIEYIYSTLLQMEDHERRMPAPTTEESSADEIQAQIDWRQRIQELNTRVWTGLKVLEPIDPTSTTIHPFIAILSHPKGKKLIPRVFRQIDDQQRLTIITMIMVHLDQLDVVRLACQAVPETPLPLGVRHDIELFSQAVMPALFAYAADAPFGLIIGLVGLITDRVNVAAVARTKIGLGLLTMFISRAELVKQSGNASESDLEQWNQLYNRLFDLVEPALPYIFTQPIEAEDDVYVWQFLAAVGIGASPEQQQRLVIGVKDRVMETVTTAKNLPDEVGRPRLDNVNLFMRAIGLDVELLG